MTTYLKKNRFFILCSCALLALLLSILACSFIGTIPIQLSDLFETDSLTYRVIYYIRLPRIFIAAFVGIALSASGATYQSILKNPLADPYILGISGGAALGHVISISLGLSLYISMITAFTGALLALILIVGMTQFRPRSTSLDILLSGIVLNAFCFALILFINATTSMEQAYHIIFMLIGHIESMDITIIALAGVFITCCFTLLIYFSRTLNILQLGDHEALLLGIPIKRTRIILLLITAVLIGASIAISGMIGFIGIIVPHIIRIIFGADNRLIIPMSGLVGASFLIIADTVARHSLSAFDIHTQLPVGVITALIGAPLFLSILHHNMRFKKESN